MLGIKSHRPPIEGDIADEIRDAVVRVAKGQLNEEEKAVQERLKKALEKYEVKWELKKRTKYVLKGLRIFQPF